MCTLVLLQRPGELLAVSGNRNELLARPASGPRVEKGVLAPRDELAHGSWLGLALAELHGDRHNGFHLAYADLSDAFVSWSDGFAVHHLPLAAGRVHVITERSFGAGEAARERSVASAFAGLEPDLRAWREPMTKHASEPLESACVHADAVGYGTRSSLQLLVRPAGASALWTDGHPCVNEPRDISGLAAALFSPPR